MCILFGKQASFLLGERLITIRKRNAWIELISFVSIFLPFYFTLEFSYTFSREFLPAPYSCFRDEKFIRRKIYSTIRPARSTLISTSRGERKKKERLLLRTLTATFRATSFETVWFQRTLTDPVKKSWRFPVGNYAITLDYFFSSTCTKHEGNSERGSSEVLNTRAISELSCERLTIKHNGQGCAR